jgi:LmeA-like phospholipid-binding
VTASSSRSPAPGRRRLGLFARLLIIVVALVALVGVAVVALDGPARAVAQDSTAAALQKQVPFTAKPSVTIEGWPFLWDAVVGFPQVRVSAPGMPVTSGSDKVTLSDPDFTLTGVVARPQALTATALRGTAVLSYAELSRLAGGSVTYADGDRIKFTAHVTLYGRDFDAVVTGVPTLDVQGQTLTIGQASVDIAGVTIPQVPVDAIASVVAKPIAVTLPFGLQVRAVSATAAGVRADVGGTDVTLPTGG